MAGIRTNVVRKCWRKYDFVLVYASSCLLSLVYIQLRAFYCTRTEIGE